MQEFYTWRWIVQERRKAEAGDKTAFGPTNEELAAEYLKRKANG